MHIGIMKNKYAEFIRENINKANKPWCSCGSEDFIRFTQQSNIFHVYFMCMKCKTRYRKLVLHPVLENLLD